MHAMSRGISPWRPAKAMLQASAWRVGAPIAAPGIARLTLSGEPVTLPAELAMRIGFVLHELAVGAAARGTFGPEGGPVELRWTEPEAGMLTLVWHEAKGVAPVPAKAEAESARIVHAIPDAEVSRAVGTDGYSLTIRTKLPMEQGPAR